MRRHSRRKGIAWFRRRPAWGTVYLMQSLDEPDLFKVGFTKRLTKSRRGELKGKVGGRLKIYYTLSMPNAYFVEQRVLRGLRARWFGRGDRRGTEWFRLRKKETLPDIVGRIDVAARRIRLISKLKLSWPSGQEFVVYKSWDRTRKEVSIKKTPDMIQEE
ncbi:GIY-YIG nuclease family protein [Phaeobacter sp. JH20_18]|uniref:GIY-YIG nuclease family protein n=1 Tax=Phaeobacter sp. JH20_18 TaxID=3112476 RepID=UPI003A88C7E2